MNRYDPQYPECDCQRCDWCHDAYEHNWYDWVVPIEQWDCRACQTQYENAVKDSFKSNQCEYHDKDRGIECSICKELAFQSNLDRVIDSDIEYGMEVKHEEQSNSN